MTDIDIYQPAELDHYQAALAMTPDQAKALDDQLRACTRAVLREGTDYGIIPGTGGDKTLLKPGAEKLLQWFGFAYTMSPGDIERDEHGIKQGVTYRCTIFKRGGGNTVHDVATCEGYAGYDEDRFYQPAEVAQAKAEARERMWAKKDGRVANPTKWQHIADYRAPWNTVIKMAQKRALVGATVDATAAAGLFRTEDDPAAPADDGSTWYEQAIEAALTFDDQDAGRKLFVEAAHAARDGLCTPRQANHVQNRIEQRARRLKNAVAVEVEDLGKQAAAAQAAAEESQEPAEDTLPVEEPPAWPETAKPGTGTPKGK